MKRRSKTERAIYERFKCVDCTVNTFDNDEYYVVRDELWRKAGMRFGMLCVECLENRLGRQLQPYDFERCPLNDEPEWARSPRLQGRIDGIQEAVPA